MNQINQSTSVNSVTPNASEAGLEDTQRFLEQAARPIIATYSTTDGASQSSIESHWNTQQVGLARALTEKNFEQALNIARLCFKFSYEQMSISDLRLGKSTADLGIALLLVGVSTGTEFIEHALKLLRRFNKAENITSTLMLVCTLRSCASAYSHVANHAQALCLLQEANTHLESKVVNDAHELTLLNLDGGTVTTKQALIINLKQMCATYNHLGDTQNSISCFRKIVGHTREAYGDNSFEYADALDDLALLHLKLKHDLPKAKSIALKAEEVMAGLSEHKGMLAHLHLTMAQIDFAQELYQEALDRFQRGMDLALPLASASEEGFIEIYMDMAKCHLALQHLDEADECFEKAKAIITLNFGPKSSQMLALLSNMVEPYLAAERPGLARKHTQTAAQLARELLGPDSETYLHLLLQLGQIDRTLHSSEKAIESFDLILELADPNQSGLIELTSRALTHKAQIALSNADRASAEDFLTKALKILGQSSNQATELGLAGLCAQVEFQLAQVKELLGKEDEAEQLVQRSLEYFEKSPDINIENIAMCQNILARIAIGRNNFNVATTMYDKTIFLLQTQNNAHTKYSQIMTSIEYAGLLITRYDAIPDESLLAKAEFLLRNAEQLYHESSLDDLESLGMLLAGLYAICKRANRTEEMESIGQRLKEISAIASLGKSQAPEEQ